MNFNDFNMNMSHDTEKKTEYFTKLAYITLAIEFFLILANTTTN